jgi:membrane protease YdiL (CAAX protease family)
VGDTKSEYRVRILTFLGLTFGLSAIFWTTIAQAGTLNAGGGAYTLALMWCPGIAALSTTLVFQRNLSGLGWRLGQRRYLLPAYFLPIGYGLVAYGLVWLTGLGVFTTDNLPALGSLTPESLPPSAKLAGFLVVISTAGIVVALLSATGEELGWRGLLVPELARRLSFNQTALLSGVIWTIWHLPLILFADYHSATPRLYAIACFTVMVLGMSFLLAWLRLRSGSVWPAALLHASHNLWVQAVFDPLTRDTGATAYLTGEFGALLALAIGVAAALCVLKGSDEVAATVTAPG